ncbi:hypothetical protein SUGI_1224050 [Cryptomeria japonica]|uniref:Uncharacterized protein n=1 Tax=Cryptomeria japonica TaxID=3369 RepID=A0AAD3NPN2_CRYJA|nr:hypothetical protein SUGI_1224050 [Cryptomeria japonica]
MGVPAKQSGGPLLFYGGGDTPSGKHPGSANEVCFGMALIALSRSTGAALHYRPSPAKNEERIHSCGLSPTILWGSREKHDYRLPVPDRWAEGRRKPVGDGLTLLECEFGRKDDNSTCRWSNSTHDDIIAYSPVDRSGNSPQRDGSTTIEPPAITRIRAEAMPRRGPTAHAIHSHQPTGLEKCCSESDTLDLKAETLLAQVT